MSFVLLGGEHRVFTRSLRDTRVVDDKKKKFTKDVLTLAQLRIIFN